MAAADDRGPSGLCDDCLVSGAHVRGVFRDLPSPTRDTAGQWHINEQAPVVAQISGL